jgi:uncharacterized damage-inducible protein DinB
MLMNTTVLALGLALLTPGAALAQTQDPLTAGAKAQFGAITDFVVRSAQKIPDDTYSFRATPEVRTISELFGHISDALFGMCSTANAAKPPRTGIEKAVRTKPELIKALNEGIAYCNTVFASMNDKKGTEMVQFYFGPTPKLSVLYFATTHTYEHYGNLVTYMRLKGIVPPSSEPPAKK